MRKLKTKVFIIGGGPAGYTAAIYASRANLQPIQALGIQPGGQLMTTTEVENYPGFSKIIQGPFLMKEMRLQAEKVGTLMLEESVINVHLKKHPFIAETEDQTQIEAESIIITTGAQAKWLELESERKYRGFGVSGCATCDGFFFKNKKVAVIGGGNTAVEEALFLTHHASQVYLVHRRDQLKAEKILQERLFKNPKITVIWDHIVEEIVGTEDPKSVTSLYLKNVKTQILISLDVEGVFIAIGHAPQTSLFIGQLDLDHEGYIITKPDHTATNIEGVFAAGDVRDKIFRQAVTAAGQGCMAALEAERFLQSIS
ncbi:MAG: thioredoxin-disulfide reductase [Proteobacteria bacterium]|nr:thioredoxin-disulfide reductase [Pseudomonadota bacterium]